ncbi:dihydroxyacetone kinase subunit DhaK [Clostridium ganghwense]|uniref:Dihydroxyacetone kinase subunit DhaK n=1 Tax=Clostridium ganghwense TaxID=312089 RepID=A0ABT4CLM5_9CLOT|nr:dihydroxyacetone kinase subunit DhaK [Clostridium ganghwense]MCY6369146.1 dihydroxyacetone kinase subunit DhaK [Clostridium ganghwense]
MKKFINKPENYVDEMIKGILYAHPNKLKCVNNDLKCLTRAYEVREGKVGIATGGGSGHLPLFLGYVGEGLIDGASVGNVFASPSAAQMYEVTKEIDEGRGVLYLYGNYTGDIMNFDMAAEMADMDGIRVTSVVGNDDVASSKKGEENKRRGIAGLVFAYKTAGAYAEEGADLDEVTRIAQKTVDNTRTMGVALSPCVIPEIGKNTFSIGEDEMEIGMGIHGEHGINRGKLLEADEVVNVMMEHIFNDYEYKREDEVVVLINGLGSTPLDELYIVYRRVYEILQEKGIKIHRKYIGEFATSMEMAGMSISLLKLDEELKRLIDAPCASPFFMQK